MVERCGEMWCWERKASGGGQGVADELECASAEDYRS
jgi:hypothetical protein